MSLFLNVKNVNGFGVIGGMTTKMNRIKRFVKERDKALLSMDVEKIRSYAKKYDISCPKDEKIVLVGAAKAILQINSASDEQKSKAGRWLLDNGFTLDIN